MVVKAENFMAVNSQSASPVVFPTSHPCSNFQKDLTKHKYFCKGCLLKDFKGGGKFLKQATENKFPGWHSGKESACQCRRCKRRRFDPCIRKIPWRRAWQTPLVFLPGKSMFRGPWQATVPGVAKSQTRLK